MIGAVRTIAAAIAFIAATVFAVAGVVGIFRFRDPYSKLQAGSLCGTTSVFSVFLGALILAPSWAMAARLLVIIAIFLVSSPTGTHIVGRFMWNSGLAPRKPRPGKNKPTETGNPPDTESPEAGGGRE